jgi:hypothetical protein
MSDYVEAFSKGRKYERERVLDLLDTQGNLVALEGESDTLVFIRNLMDFIEREYHA